MSGYKNNGDKKYSGDLKVNLSAGDNKIKYYECSGDNCIFEILDDELCNNDDNNTCCDFDNKEKEINSEHSINGRIVVKSILDCGRQEALKGVKINLYKINGLSPILVKSQLTNEEGEVVFSNIEDGSYRVIEIVNKEYFEKPKYINWNEITINCNNKKEKILVVNKLKKYTGKHN